MSASPMSVSDSTSWSLVLGAAAALPEERERFCERYQPIIRSYLAARWRLSQDHERVLDGCQEVFVTLLAPGGPLERMQQEQPDGFGAYLRGVTRHVAARMERTNRRRRERETRYAQSPQPSEATLSRVFDRAWIEMLLGEAWRMMREGAQGDHWGELRLEILKLRFVDDLTPPEIVKQIPSLDIRQVYRLSSTGRDQFRRSMMSVLSGYHPDLSYAALDQRCRELLEML